MKPYQKYKAIVAKKPTTESDVPHVVFTLEAGRPGLTLNRSQLEKIAFDTMAKVQLLPEDHTIIVLQDEDYEVEDGDEVVLPNGEKVVVEG